MYPYLHSPVASREAGSRCRNADHRRDRLLEKARSLRARARNADDLWLAEQYEAAAAFICRR